MILRLAWRNVLRNARRTSITMLAIVSGMIGIIVFGGFIEFTFWGLRETSIRTQLGHIQIYRRGYLENGVAAPYRFLIENVPEVEAIVKKVPSVKVVTARLGFSGLISTGDRTLTAKGSGVMPEREEELSTFETVIEGAPLRGGTAFQAVVGSELQKGLGVKVGENVTVLTTTVTGSINAANFRLVGVGQTGSLDYDSVFVKLPLTQVQALLDTHGVERMVVLLEDTQQTAEVAALLKKRFEEAGLPLEIRTWQEMATFYDRVVALYSGIFQVIKVIIGFIVFFSVANTMTMAVFERVREIGTLRAMGTTRSSIVKLFLTEGLLIGLLGGFFGIVAGSFVAWAINTSGGIAIPPPPGMSRGYVSLILIVPKVLAYAFLSTLVVASLSSAPPAVRALRLSVVDALRHT
jgi:putative ABC transport system permease protein